MRHYIYTSQILFEFLPKRPTDLFLSNTYMYDLQNVSWGKPWRNSLGRTFNLITSYHTMVVNSCVSNEITWNKSFYFKNKFHNTFTTEHWDEIFNILDFNLLLWLYGCQALYYALMRNVSNERLEKSLRTGNFREF